MTRSFAIFALVFSLFASIITSPALAGTRPSTIAAPDSTTPYTCTFHWFRLADGRTIGMDVIRSDDTGQYGLRLFVIDHTGAPRGHVRVLPSTSWATQWSGARPAFPEVDARAQFIGRGTNWVAAASTDPGAGIRRVSFSLTMESETPRRGFAALGPTVARMNALDFERVRTRGTLRIDDQVFAIDGVGPVSIHAGEFLPEYAYVALVPNAGDQEISFVAASVAGDNFRLGGPGLAYAYSSGWPTISFAARAIDAIPLAEGIAYDFGRLRVIVTDVRRNVHELLGMRTVTASARAVLRDEWTGEERLLGRVVLDFRGNRFVSELPAEPLPTR